MSQGLHVGIYPLDAYCFALTYVKMGCLIISPIVPPLCHPVSTSASLASTHQATLLALPTELRLVIYTHLGNGLSPDPPSIRL